MKILVTGGMGYIGSKIISRLERDNHEITILDNFSTNIIKQTKDKEVLRADIADFESLKVLKRRGIDTVLHLAAQSSGAASFKNPEQDLKVNILGTLNMIRLCELWEIPRILFASSFTVYGDNADHEILSEDLPCDPKSLYGIGKLTGELYLKVYAEKLGIKWNALRMFNVYGPGQDLSRKDQGMVSIFLSYIKEGNYVPVQGSLDRFRDHVYIDDVVEAWVACIKNNDFSNQIFNVGSGKKTTIKELIDKIIGIYNKEVIVETTGYTPGDMMGCYADISKITRDLGYSPTYDLDSGLLAFKQWADEEGAYKK
jgi:UDP-glucose 4-epimerase